MTTDLNPNDYTRVVFTRRAAPPCHLVCPDCGENVSMLEADDVVTCDCPGSIWRFGIYAERAEL